MKSSWRASVRLFQCLAATSVLIGGGASADTLATRWAVAPGERLYVATGNTERGLAYNPKTGNLLLVGRAEGPKVYVLRGSDGTDGVEELGEPRVLNPLDEVGDPVISGGTFTLNLVGVGEDGAVYACNLATSLGTVKIYRWADDSTTTPVTLAYTGNPLEAITEPGSGQDIRFGDNFAVRGGGKDTQLLQTARNGKYILLYTTVDGVHFTSRVFTPGGDISGKIGLALAFGEGNTFWAKGAGGALQRIGLDPATGQANLLGTIPTTVVAGGVSAVGVDTTAKLLAAVDYVAHTIRVFDISDPAGFVPLGEPLPFPAANVNANGTAAAAVSGTNVFGLDTNNGLLAAVVERSVVADPPTLIGSPAGGSVYAGGSFTFAVSAQGTPPFLYQWFLNDQALPGATSAQLTLSAVTTNQAGAYSVEVRNAAGAVTSTPATLNVRVPLAAGVLKPAWALNPGDRTYLATDNAQRGLAWNPATGNLLLASRSPSPAIQVLDAATGAFRHALRTTTEDDLPLFIGGTLVLNMVGVAEDGVVYAGNLVTDGSSASFRLYRWPSDAPDAIPAVLMDVPELAIAERWGDTMDVRGAGGGTQILLGVRGLSPQEGGKFAVLSSPDGFNFNAQVFAVPGLPASSVFGLGIAFGEGNTVFGTANGQPLVQASFDPATGSATLVRSYPAAEVPTGASLLAVDAAGKLLATVVLETPDNVLLYDLKDPLAPALLDQQLILPEQANINGTGALDFGGGRLFVLNTNHGLRAYEVIPGGAAGPATLARPRVVGGAFSVAVEGTAGRPYVVERSTDLRVWTNVGTVTAPGEFTDAAAGAAAFYRVVAP